MHRTFSLLALFVAVAMVAGYRVNARERAADVTIAGVGFHVGERAPEFNLLSVGEDRSLRSGDLIGKPVIINFFCGCNFCSIVGKEWVANRDKLGDAVVVAVQSSHWTYSPDAVRDYRKKTGWTWPVLADMQRQMANEFNALTCPRVFALDRQGIIRYASEPGASDEKQLVADALAAVPGR
jgi:peroxiredoxin